MHIDRGVRRDLSRGFLALAVLAAGACSGHAIFAPASAEEAPAALLQNIDLGRPYIGGGLPQAESLVPAAPATGSAVEAADIAANDAIMTGVGGARWVLAAQDANLGKGWFQDAFSCAAGREISDGATPALANLIRRAATDFGMSTSAVKKLYQRPRPFMVNGGPTCTPDQEDGLRGNGSYPSGHSAIGYGIGLVLAGVFPDRAATMVSRGRAYGTSRSVCNVHWMSDIEEGRIVASATFAKLTTNADFQADLAAARAEVAANAAVSNQPEKCTAEAAALARAD